VNTNATKELVLGAMTKDNVNWTWIGGSDLEEEGVWKWKDCTPWETEFWARGEPNNRNNQDCLALVLRSDGHPQLNRQWDDESCIKETEFLCSLKICSSDNVEEEETTLAENTKNSNNEEETTEADNNNGGNSLLEEDTSGASVIWKLISSTYAVLLFLLF